MSNWIELDSLIQHYKELRDTIVETDEFGLHPVPIENMIGLLRTYQGTALPDIIRCRECIHYHPCEAELIDGSAPDWGICDQPWFNDDENDVDEMFYCAQGERREDKTDKCFNEHCAHWIKENDICYDPDASCFYAEYSCSYCGAWANDRSELPECCPNCGKKMKGVK